MILLPRILHYVWLGSQPMHPLMDEWREKWRQIHPGWKINVWKQVDGCPEHLLKNDERQLIECRIPEYLAQCPTLSKRSDVWRYEILEQLGGVYLDTDFEPIKNIESHLEEISAFAGLCTTLYDWDANHQNGKTKIEIGCSIIGSLPHHPWVRELVRQTPSRDPIAKLSLASPFLTEVTGRHPEVQLFAPDVFYPVPWDRCALEGRRSPDGDVIPDTACAVHRWSSCWFPNGLKPIG
jgi:mannosyltransferase OCH1-like enzyme